MVRCGARQSEVPACHARARDIALCFPSTPASCLDQRSVMPAISSSPKSGYRPCSIRQVETGAKHGHVIRDGRERLRFDSGLLRHRFAVLCRLTKVADPALRGLLAWTALRYRSRADPQAVGGV